MFIHALTHEVAYGSLLQRQRRVMHARIVEIIEATMRDRLDEQIDRLAHHALRGEVWDKALAYFRRAGTKAASRSAYDEAAMCFEQALEALQHMPESRDTMTQGIDLRIDLRNAWHPLGEHTRILDHLHAAETLAEALGDAQRLGRVYSMLCICVDWGTGDHDRSLVIGQRAMNLAKAHGDLNFEIEVASTLGGIHCVLGNYTQAIDYERWVITAFEDGQQPSQGGRVARFP
jgi:predicted ATPase